MEVLDKNVPHTGTTQGWVALTPHDATRTSLDHRKVHGVQRTFRIGQLVKVHVRVSERTTRDGITANTDGDHRAHRTENFKQETFVGVGGDSLDFFLAAS